MSTDGDWSESYICNLFDWHLKEQETMPQLTGAAQWVFKDFATPLRPENPVPRVNQKGLVERDLTPKEAYYVFQSYWSDKPMIHLYGHSWPVRWGEAGEQKMVKVYSNCPEVELFVNGQSAGVRKRNSQNFPAAGLRWSVALQAGKNSLRAVGRRDGIEVVDEIEFEYQTQPWGKPAKLELAVVGRDGDAATIEATLRDEQGVLCLDARNMVRFGVTGDATLMDNLGTSTGSRVVQLYNGKARIRATLGRPDSRRERVVRGLADGHRRVLRLIRNFRSSSRGTVGGCSGNLSRRGSEWAAARLRAASAPRTTADSLLCRHFCTSRMSCTSIAYLVRDILWLRIITVVAMISMVPYYFYCTLTPQWEPIGWQLCSWR